MKRILAMLLMLCILCAGVAAAEEVVAPEVKPSKIVLDQEKTVTVNMGETLELGWSFEPAEAQSELTWSSSSKKIAKVEDGVVTPVKEGTATIAVKTANGKKDAVKVKVVDPYKPTKVELDASGTVIVNIDDVLVLDAILTPETAQTKLTWSSSSKKIAKVDDGVVTPVKEGTATITVKTANGKKDTVKVKVVDPYKPAKVELDASGTVTLNMGETLELSAVLTPETAQTKLTWSSSSKKIAKVEDGVVTPVKEGTATITVKTANGKKDTVKVKVVDPYKPTKVELEQSGTITLKKGEYLMLHPVLYPVTAQSELTWKSSSPKVASVSQDGLVQAHKAGTATITVTTRNGKKDTVKIKVPDTMDISVYSVDIGYNSLGDPEVYVRFKNEGSVPIDRVDFDIRCYDAYGDLVKGYGYYIYSECWYEASTIYPQSLSNSGHYWELFGFEGTRSVSIRIRKYHTTSGETVKIPSGKQQWVHFYP